MNYTNNAILVTGATGFIGRALCNHLIDNGWVVYGTLLPSENQTSLVAGVKPVAIEPLTFGTPCAHAFAGINTVIHLAARVHVMKESAADPLREFRAVNVDGTECLARQAAVLGVKRFVFMSTIGVNGDNSGSASFTENNLPSPVNGYSISKYEAELRLSSIASETGIEIVVIRAPLVYGPGNPGNFLTLLRIVSKGLPLPLASVNNQRSFIFVRNLIDAIMRCAAHPAAAGKIYLVSDGEDISTPDLIRRTASALKVPVRLLPFPKILMQIAGILTGKTALIDRLAGSLVIDSSRIRADLDWKPPFTLEEGLQLTASWFLDLQGRSDEADI